MMNSSDLVGNLDMAAVGDLYESWLKDPGSVDASWSHFFRGFDLAVRHFPQKPGMVASEEVLKEFSVMQLIHGYRQRGHLFTKTNPVRRRRSYTRRWISLISTWKAPTWSGCSRPAMK